MKPVYFRTSPMPSIAKILAAFSLIIVLAACGSNTAATSAPAGAKASNATDKPSIFKLNKANLSTKMGDLLVQSRAGFQCPYAFTGYGWAANPLVFTSDPTTYNTNEITQIRKYITGDSPFVVQATPNMEPPSTLRWVLGGPTGTCNAILELTNTGATPIQIPKAGVQLEARPQQNAYQYRLVDACSLMVPPMTEGCYPPSGGGSDCKYYAATIPLGFGEKNNIYSTVPKGTNGSGIDCGILTIAPAAQVELTMTLSLAPNTPDNLIYAILPIFTIVAAQGKQTYSLPQLVSTLAFANAQQFSCYSLQGTRFVLVPSPDLFHNWCI